MADLQEGLGLGERAKVRRLMGEGKSEEEAVRIVKKDSNPNATAAPAKPATAPAGKVQPTTWQQQVDERSRVQAEDTHQATLDRAKFAAPERKDPMEGLGLSERAKVAALVREGMSQEEAINKVRRPPSAATQREALK